MLGRVPVRLLTAALAIAAASLSLAQDVSDIRLQEGVGAFRSGRPAEAIDPLRIATFGLLDRPRELCQGLVYLALAQDARGRRAEAEAVAERFSDVSRRFPGCAQAQVEASARSQFEARFRRPSVSPPAQALAPTPVPAPEEGAERIPPSAIAARTPAMPAAERPAASLNRDVPEVGPDADTPPRVAKSVPAIYPRAAREARLAGTAVIRVLVSETGRAVRLEPIRGPLPLTEAAMASIRRWTFEPAQRNGRAIEAWTVIEVPFHP